ncbi:serine protease [Actinoplanes xinjiangensis]|uniref:serine protease n=1 Tax=Actinoplanes xinjiangensis TaxID=512350 RepID=UPI003417F1DE
MQRTHETALLQRPQVVGVALGHKFTGGRDTGERAITVLVTRKLPVESISAEDLVPPVLDGVPTDVQEVGEIRAGTPTLASAEALRQRIRPAFGGLSVGHYKVTAGTLATCCYDAASFPGSPSRYYLLSNNHVLANSNDAAPGDPILQPGAADGGSAPDDVIGRLARFVPIAFLGSEPVRTNLVDAAIAEAPFQDLDRRIFWTGTVRRVRSAPTVGELVQKCGRTTNFTTGRVLHVNATVDVNYGTAGVARFTEQILTTNMSAPGDSGSLVTDLDEQAVGLLFAGSSTVTVVNQIAHVESLLGIRIAEG